MRRFLYAHNFFLSINQFEIENQNKRYVGESVQGFFFESMSVIMLQNFAKFGLICVQLPYNFLIFFCNLSKFCGVCALRSVYKKIFKILNTKSKSASKRKILRKETFLMDSAILICGHHLVKQTKILHFSLKESQKL